MEPRSHDADEVCAAFVDRLPIDGAAISTIGGIDEPHTLTASDRVADRMDEAQLDVGEGPCWDAVQSRDWVDSPDIASNEVRWPLFRDAIRGQPIAALFAYPLRLGGLQVGTLDVYRRDTGPLPPETKRDAHDLLDRAAHVVLRSTLTRLGLDPSDDANDRAPRAIIHQATGMVIAQLELSPEDALLILRARAFAAGLALRDVARDVVERRLDFSTEPWGDRNAHD